MSFWDLLKQWAYPRLKDHENVRWVVGHELWLDMPREQFIASQVQLGIPLQFAQEQADLIYKGK